MPHPRKKTLLSMVWGAILFAVLHGTVFSAPTGPEGVEWRWVELGGTASMSLPDGKQPSMLLDPRQRKVTGFSGCNHYFGNYELDGGTLKFGILGATRKACPDEESGIERNFFDMLANTREWRISEGVLLLGVDGDVLGSFHVKQNDVSAANLESMTFHSKVLQAGPVTLAHGEYRASAAPDTASEVAVKLTDKQAFGILNDESMGAVVVVTTLGGTGTFYELALLIESTQGWINPDTVLLGDRVKVHSVVIEGGHVVVAMTTHGPQDSMCCPTLEVEKRFVVQHDRLIADSDKTFKMLSQLNGTVWQWAHTRYNNDTQTVIAQPANYTVQFLEQGKLVIKADCNLKSGTYSIMDRQLSMLIAQSTMAACSEGTLEDQFVRDLRGAAVFFFRDGDLYIDLKYDTGTMKFLPQRQE